MLLIPLAVMGAIIGCRTHHAVEIAPVEVKPIHITIDVNVRVDRALDNFFGEIDDTKKEIQQSVEEKK
jgi:hypothetical protein